MEDKKWIEKIKKGMALIKEGCDEVKEWADCAECPFREYCDLIEIHTGGAIPSTDF